MAYKTFANGFPLPASDINNFLMNQSVIVFADSAARTTAIPSPVQGMLTYLVDTSAYESWNGSAFVALAEEPDLSTLIPKSTVTTSQDLIVADGASSVTRLGVGANDQVLSVVAGSVAWADAGGGGGLTLISTTTLSGSSVVLSNIPQTYKGIRLIFNGYKTTASGTINVQTHETDGTYIPTKGRMFTGQATNHVSSTVASLTTSDSGSNPSSGEVEIMHYADTVTHLVTFSSSQSNDYYWSLGQVSTDTTAAIGQIELAGKTYNSGTVSLYGIS